MDFSIEISKETQKDITRLARRAAAIELEIAALIHRAASGIWHQENPTDGTENAAERAFAYLIAWCEQHKQKFVGSSCIAGDRIVGKWLPTDDYIYIYRDVADHLLRDGGYQIGPTLRAWRDDGRIESGNDQLRYTKQIRVIRGGDAVRVYALRIPEKKLASPENNH